MTDPGASPTATSGPSPAVSTGPSPAVSTAAGRSPMAACLVEDLLGVDSLGVRLVVRGEGLRRPIRWTHATELPDPGPYLRSEELVCTVGSVLADPAAATAYVRTVARTAPALCFGLGDVHEAPPRALVDACREARLTLLTLPQGIPFLAVSDVLEEFGAREREAAEVGRLLDLVHEGLAKAPSVAPVLRAAGIDADDFVVAAWPADQGSRIGLHLPGAVVGQARDVTFALLPTAEALTAGALTAVSTATGLPCGYSDPCGLDALPAAMAAARSALAACPETGGPQRAGSAPSFAGLLDTLPPERLAPFVAVVVEPLLGASGRTSPGYLDTLRSYLAHDLSVGRTAKAQFLHPNTVRHRLALVRELTGLDPFRTADLLALAIAVHAYDRGVAATRPTPDA